MTVRDRVTAHRRRMRGQGLRPIQFWVPDVRAAGFADEARRQSQLVAEADARTDDQAFVDAITVDPDE